MKRPRDFTHSPLRFFIFNPIDKHCATYETFQYGKEQDFYVLKFHRPGLKQAHLYTFYALNDEGTCIYSTKLEDGEPGETMTLMDRTYKVYETYTLGQDGGETTHSIYFQISSSPPRRGGEEHPQNESYRICCDMSLKWLPKNLPHFVRGVRFFPYDIDIAQYGLKLDTPRIIQRTPIWFKVRGEVSGTKAYQLIGFWVPTKQKDPTWTIDGDHVFDAKSKANMRFGSESEDKGLITYALHAKNVTKIGLAGWCNAPASAGLPLGWGASPDGLVVDPTHTWEKVPENIGKYLFLPPPPSGGEEGTPKGGDQTPPLAGGFDPTLGVLEIKSSPSKLSFEPYFFPQVYMEMISTHRIWCDLVRYTPSKVRIYRIYRHKPTEETLISLWKYARKHAHNLRDIVQEEPFVKIRNYFTELAKQLTFIEIPTATTEIASYETYQKEQERRTPVKDTSFLLQKKQKSTWFQEVDTNHKAFYGAVNDPAKLKQLILKQMDLYTQVLKDLP